MLRITKFVILVALLSLFLAPAAMAKALGPVEPLILGTLGGGNGYPATVTDNSVPPITLDLPNPPYGDGINAPTLIFDPVIPDNATSLASGFGAEGFFYLAESVVDVATGGKALLVLGIEAAYGAGDPDPLSPPDQFLFARVRVRFDPVLAGTYTATHPWGVEKMVVTAADVGTRFSHTVDWGGFAPIPNPDPTILTPLVPSSFERILYSPKDWVFLTAVNKSANAGQADWIIGDGVTPTEVTRSDGGIVTFTINGPADGTGIGPIVATSGAGIPTAVTTNLPPAAQTTDIVTITRSRLRGNSVEVRATSSNGFSMTAELLRQGVLVGSLNLGTGGRGNVPFTGANPDTVRVHSTSNNPAILGGVATAAVTP
jgi:hypothetical protein